MNRSRDAFEELLIDHATEGLSAAQWEDLLRQHQDSASLTDTGFERAAAAIDLAHTEDEPMPAALRQRVEDQAKGFWQAKASESQPLSTEGAEILPFRRAHGETPAPSQASVDPSPTAPSTGARSTPWKGWAVAVAASLVAAVGWAPRIAEQMTGPPTQLVGGPVGQPERPTQDFAARRQQLMGSSDGFVQVAWTATEDPAAVGVSGDLVWSTELQEGYMLFNGLPVNDAAEWQYQLWIFDRRQDERFPIDGGIFDVGADGAVIVPIQAKLQVGEPYLFAVTIEKPGGVVVSSRERLPLVATL